MEAKHSPSKSLGSLLAPLPAKIIRPSYGPSYSPPKKTMGANRPRKLNNWLQIEQGWMIAFLQYGYSETISTLWAIENDRTYFRLSFWSMYELICKISIVRVCKLRFASNFKSHATLLWFQEKFFILTKVDRLNISLKYFQSKFTLKQAIIIWGK